MGPSPVVMDEETPILEANDWAQSQANERLSKLSTISHPQGIGYTPIGDAIR
jgi:hypothetical protein